MSFNRLTTLEDMQLVNRLNRIIRDMQNIKLAQAIGSDSLLIYRTEMPGDWDLENQVMLGTNFFSQWTVTFTPADTSKPVYCEFEVKSEITHNSSSWDYKDFTWDSPETVNSNIKRFVVWRQNDLSEQRIRYKFAVRSTQPGTLTWRRDA